MKINNKLKKISSLISDNSFVLDVGCDHALLDIYTCLTRKNVAFLATDINALPLKKAKENINKYHMEDKIKTALKNGLEALTIDISTIVISGMGGVLIKELILKDKNKITNQTIILCPNNDSDIIRKSLLENNFKLINEYLVKDKYIYEILVYQKGHDNLSKKEILYGKYLKKEDLFKEYYYKKKEELQKIKKSLPKKYVLKTILLNKKIKDITKLLS